MTELRFDDGLLDRSAQPDASPHSPTVRAIAEQVRRLRQIAAGQVVCCRFIDAGSTVAVLVQPDDPAAHRQSVGGA
jgi:hypothetical protein